MFIKYYYINKVNPNNILNSSKLNIQEIISDIRILPKQLKNILRNIEKNNISIQIEDVKFSKLETTISDLATKLSLSLVLNSF